MATTIKKLLESFAEPIKDDSRYLNSLPFKELPLSPDIGSDRSDLFKYFTLSSEPTPFAPKDYHLFHGTSTDALDMILDDGYLRSAAVLDSMGKLVSGEIKRMRDKSGSSGMNLLHPEFLEKYGFELTDYDKRMLGHAYAVFFAGHYSGALPYTSKDPNKKALLVINKNVLDDRGYTLVDCQGEGIKCDSRISLDFGFQALLVPDNRVAEYKARIEGKYFTSVFPLSDLRKKE